MAIQKKEKILEDNLYQILLPAPTVCIPLCTRAAVLVAPIISGGIGAASSGVATEGSTLEKIKTLIGPALVSMTSAISKADPDASNKLMMDAVMAAHLCCNGQPISTQIDFDRHFDEHRADVYPVMTWVLWECVKDFFPKLGGSPLQTIRETMLSAFLSQMGGATSTGSVDPAGTESVPTQS